ncbi:carbohydrate kinase family protein [Verticiella sediminum]|uniref:Carbohydrate kinase family protein n=1 Tax=Verticiella sediminum TaxID=1247510 RepID=A0A556A7T4_9BURK|nr:carbohydrate kinase family protein [Verticiella sediminum]TSH88949.1 carbohydrate kinase family protein [Verticiella sediminum]
MTAPVIVCGSMAFDTIMLFDGHFKDHILPDQIHTLSVSFLVPGMRKEFGGCSGNIAYSLRLLGGNPIPVATVGVDAEDYLARLRGLGIETRWVRVAGETFTAQCFITNDLSDNQITAFHPGAMALSAGNDLTEAPGEWGIVAPDAKDAMFAHAERLHARGIPFVFDLGQAMPLFDKADLERMLGLAQVLTVNDYEGHVVEQRIGRSMREIATGLQAVVVTRGAEGATLYENGEQVQIAAVKPDAVVDPTGCGDAYRAGLLYGVTNGWRWADACRLASVMGAIKVAHRGPQNHQPTREEIARRLKDAYGLEM